MHFYDLSFTKSSNLSKLILTNKFHDCVPTLNYMRENCGIATEKWGFE